MISSYGLRRLSAALAVAGAVVCAIEPLAGQTGLPPYARARQGPDSTYDSVVPAASTRADTNSGTAGGTVPVELLRHPLDSKTRRMLQKALEAMNSGNHEAAIVHLQGVLEKHPEAAYYAHSFLGVAYLKTDRFASAVDSFEKAVAIVPRDAVNHYNLGLSLVSERNYERGREEVQRAVELDPNNTAAKALLDSLRRIQRAGR